MQIKSVLKIVGATLVTSLGMIGVLPMSSAHAADSQLKEILTRGVVRVGVQGAFKPWSQHPTGRCRALR